MSAAPVSFFASSEVAQAVSSLHDDHLRWEPVLAANPLDSGAALGARTYFTLSRRGRALFFFGGFGNSKKRYNDLVSFHVDTKTWTKHATTGTPPPPLYLHSVAMVDDLLYCFGGSMGHDSGDLYVYNFERAHWRQLQPRGTLPSPRYGQGMVVCGLKLYIAGGCQSNAQYLADSFEYNLATNTWRKLGDLGMEMAYHTMFAYRNDVFIAFGYNGREFSDALYRLDVDSGEWMRVPVSGNVPERRCGSTVSVHGRYAYIFGGYVQAGHTNSLHRLDLETFTWEEVPVRGTPPLPRAYLQAATVDDVLYVYGGYNGKCVEDFYQLQLEPRMPEFGPVFADDSKSPEAKAAFALGFFDRDGDGKLDAREVAALLANLQETMPTTQTNHVEQAPIDFDTSLMQDAIGVGFDRPVILECMRQLHKEGRDTTNFNLLLDRLVNYVPEPASTAPAAAAATPGGSRLDPPLEQPSLGRQKSERTELRERLAMALEDQQDMRRCKVCFDAHIEVALQPCGHLCLCQGCREDLDMCPICRVKIQSSLSIYW